MNIYRIDTPSGPVTDLCGVRLIRRCADARAVARHIARNAQVPATLVRISGAGNVRAIHTYQP